MRITPKDRDIYKYIEKEGFATVKQIGNIFFNDIIYKNELAKKRLNCLVEHGYVREVKSTNCNQHIFYSNDKFKKQSYHNIVVMDLYSKFLEMRKVDVIKFEREKSWFGGKVISDAFITISFNGKIQSYIVEVQASNNLWRKSIDKYADVDVLQEVVNQAGGVFPTMIFVDELNHNLDGLGIPFPVAQIDMKLTDFPLVFDTNK